MTIAELFHFVAANGLQTKEVVILVVGTAFLAIFPWVVADARKKQRNQLTYGDLVSTFSPFIIGVCCLLFAWAVVRTRYLLQSGSGRYTVATVYEHYTQRGHHRYVCEFYIDRHRWQTGKTCGTPDGPDWPCPPIGQRIYLYFAPEDPGANEVIATPVPDSVRVIPPLGWAKLP